MKKYTSAHIGHGDESHDNEGAHQVALGPCFEDEAIGIRGLVDNLALLESVEGEPF